MVKIGNIEIGDFPLLLAPMEDVSDPPFRAVCKQHGADLMYTEFISSEGLIRDAVKSRQKLDIFEYERPIGIQIFGNDIESMREATEITAAAHPDIIDINYGCPVKKVACKGAGAGILQDIPKMVAMTAEIVKSTSLPVTVKTRLGWDDDTKYIEEVAERLQDVGIKGLSIHGRTRKQMYKGEAGLQLIGDVKNNPRMHIPVFGNGDIDSPKKVIDYKENILDIQVKCSKGTYIRVLAEDIGEALGCGAHLAALTREIAGGFTLCQAVSFEALEALPLADRMAQLLPVDAFATSLDRMSLDPEQARRITTGLAVPQTGVVDGSYRLYGVGEVFLGVGTVEVGVLKARRLTRQLPGKEQMENCLSNPEVTG